ncbi:streptogramin lyase [Clostridium beijerinckii]|nr:streptogramin lyase [Clostridium beijerinckii]NSB76227.1 streptogramin lyase [Clostridium beijerinckii]
MKIDTRNTSDKVGNVVFSTATHSLYIKIDKANGKSDLYYANVMNQLEKVRSNKEIGNIVVPTTSTNAVMEMGNGATILNSPNNIEIPNAKVIKILGNDINDNVYFGEEVSGNITKIYYSALNEGKIKWNMLILPKPVSKEDIIVDYSGKVYINDKSAGSVLELISKKTIKYEGDLLQSYSKGIISINGNKLTKYEIGENRISIKQ